MPGDVGARPVVSRELIWQNRARRAKMHTVHVTEEVGLRERKKQATRAALTSAARHLVSERGFDAVTAEMICDLAGVSVRTFFNYFDSKESAVLGAQEPIGSPETRAEFLAGGPSGQLLPDLLGLLFPVETFVEARREEFLELIRLTQLEPRLLAAQLSRIGEQEREVAELVSARCGLPADDPTSLTAAAVSFALLRRTCVDWLAHDGRDGNECLLHVQRQAADLLRLP